MGTIVTETEVYGGLYGNFQMSLSTNTRGLLCELAMIIWVESYQPYLSFTTVEFTLKTSGNPLPPRS